MSEAGQGVVVKKLEKQEERAVLQLQPQPPPQQEPPLAGPDPGDPDDELPLPLGALNTESCIEFFVPAHFGHAISCVLFKTMRSNSVSHSSQIYS